MTGSRVVALGHYQPDRVLTNAELATTVETNDEWIQSRVGIRERRIAASDEQVDEMAWRAADKAVANVGIDKTEIDYVVVATCTAIDGRRTWPPGSPPASASATRPRST